MIKTNFLKEGEFTSKFNYRKAVLTCGFLKSIVTSILGFAILLIFNNILQMEKIPVSPIFLIIVGGLLFIICISLILIADNRKLKSKDKEIETLLDEIKNQTLKEQKITE